MPGAICRCRSTASSNDHDRACQHPALPRSIASMRSVAVISLVMLSVCTACSSAPSGTEQGSEDTDTDSGEVCEPPVNATPSETATIRVRNDRDVQLYVLP